MKNSMRVSGWLSAGLGLLALAGCSSNGGPTSPNNTPTPAGTPLPTNTSTATFTPTLTGTPTNTRTPSFTGTPTNTGTATSTFTSTSTPTSTDSSTPTSTPTNTGTPTNSLTPTVTFTPTLTVSFTPTATITNTPTITQTPTVTPSATLSPTPLPYYTFSYTLGTSGTAPGQFADDYSVAATVSGSTTMIYVSDKNNNRIQVYNSTSSSWTTYGGTSSGSAQGQFNVPLNLGADGSGHIFVADQGNSRIQEYKSGSWSTISLTGPSTVGYFGEPSGLALDSTGNVYVFDLGNADIQKYTQGSATWSLSCPVNSYTGNLGSGLGVDSSGTTFYVADTVDNRIWRYTGGYTSGSWSVFESGSGAGAGQFNSPNDVKVDNQGNVFVDDMLNFRIQVFAPNGSFITQFGSYGYSGNGVFNYPGGVGVDNQNPENAYVADSSNNRIQVFSYVP